MNILARIGRRRAGAALAPIARRFVGRDGDGVVLVDAGPESPVLAVLPAEALFRLLRGEPANPTGTRPFEPPIWSM